MPRNGSGAFSNVPGTTVTPNTTIQSAWANAFSADVEATFNTAWPVSLGGNGVTDNKPLANSFGIRDNADLTKVAIFDVASIPTATTRTYTFPATSGTLALISDNPTGRVRAATTSNITIATALNGGDVLDGVTLADGDLVLVKNQTAPADNGVYIVGTTPVRAPAYSTWASFMASPFTVAEGTVNAVTIWISATPKAGTIGVTAIPFRQQTEVWEPIEKRTLSLQNEDFTGLSAYVMWKLTLYFSVSANGEALRIRTSTTNGTGGTPYDSGASDYNNQFDRAIAGTPSGGAVVDSYGIMSPVAAGNAAGVLTCMTITAYGFNKAVQTRIVGVGTSVDTSSSVATGSLTVIRSQATARDAFRIYVASGTISGFAILEGVRG